MIDLENYAKIDSIRPNRPRGGASMFIDSKHNFIQRTDLNIKTTGCDSVFIEIPDKNIIVGIVYKPDVCVDKNCMTLCLYLKKFANIAC